MIIREAYIKQRIIVRIELIIFLYRGDETLEQGLIDELIATLKMIVYDNPTFTLPNRGAADSLNLKSNNFYFFIDVNRRGRKKPKFTLQLREQKNRDKPLLRLDILGPEHPNPEGNFPYAGEIIPCPHIHIAHEDYGTAIAYPLNEEYAKMYLSEDEISDLILTLKAFLNYCRVGNIRDMNFISQEELI